MDMFFSLKEKNQKKRTFPKGKYQRITEKTYTDMWGQHK